MCSLDTSSFWFQLWQENKTDVFENWNLVHDVMLLNYLESFYKNLLVNCNNASNIINNLSNDFENLLVRFDLSNNEFQRFRNAQFIESRVYEDEESLLVMDQLINKIEEDEKDIFVKNAALSGIEIVEKYFIKENVSNEKENGCVFQRKDVYAERLLLHPICSEKWNQNWQIKLEETKQSNLKLLNNNYPKDTNDAESKDEIQFVSGHHASVKRDSMREDIAQKSQSGSLYHNICSIKQQDISCNLNLFMDEPPPLEEQESKIESNIYEKDKSLNLDALNYDNKLRTEIFDSDDSDTIDDIFNMNKQLKKLHSINDSLVDIKHTNQEKQQKETDSTDKLISSAIPTSFHAEQISSQSNIFLSSDNYHKVPKEEFDEPIALFDDNIDDICIFEESPIAILKFSNKINGETLLQRADPPKNALFNRDANFGKNEEPKENCFDEASFKNVQILDCVTKTRAKGAANRRPSSKNWRKEVIRNSIFEWSPLNFAQEDAISHKELNTDLASTGVCDILKANATEFKSEESLVRNIVKNEDSDICTTKEKLENCFANTDMDEDSTPFKEITCTEADVHFIKKQGSLKHFPKINLFEDDDDDDDIFC